MPPKTTVSAWLTNQHNLYLNTLGQNKQVYNIGNDFTGYRVLDCLDKQGLLDSIPSIGSTAQGYKSGKDVLDSVKTILANVRAIESKWRGDLALDNSNQIEGRGEEEYYQMLINQGMKEPDARRVMSIKEVNQYLRQLPRLTFQEGRTNKDILNAYLTCMVWNRTKANGQKEVITYHKEVFDQIQQACENAEEPLKDIFYKTQYTDKAHGSFLEIQQRANWQLEGINGDAAFRINARIDTTNFTSDELPIARIAGEIEQKVIRTKDGREVRVWSMTPDAKQKYEAVYLDQKKLENKPDPINEYAPYISRIGISKEELAAIVAKGNRADIQQGIVEWFNSQDAHNFGFTYNGNVYLFNNSEYSLTSRPTSLATTDNLVLKGVDNNGEHDITITFNVDGNGNITSMQGNTTTFKQVKAESNKIAVSEEEWKKAQDGIRKHLMSNVLGKTSSLLHDYSALLKANTRQHIIDTRKTAVRFRNAANNRKDAELVKAWEDMIAIIDSLQSKNIPAISLENGDTVIWNNERYTITDKETMLAEKEDTGEQVTLTTDNLIKEETQCIPVEFKMI